MADTPSRDTKSDLVFIARGARSFHAKIASTTHGSLAKPWIIVVVPADDFGEPTPGPCVVRVDSTGRRARGELKRPPSLGPNQSWIVTGSGVAPFGPIV